MMRRLAGTVVAVVAPGGYAPDDDAYRRADDLLRSFGCTPRFYCSPADKYLRFGAADAARAAQLHDAAADPEAQIVLALRGGYGMSRLLPLLDFERLAASGKRFVGHSDFTAFHLALLARCGGVSFAGPMICDDFSRAEPSAFTLEHFAACLSEEETALEFFAPDNPSVDTAGILWGGNLTMLNHLLGTPYFPQVPGGILFLEDVNEHPYRIERMLLQLLHAGVLAKQSAIVLGDFSRYKLADYDNGYDFGGMLSFIRELAGIPVLSGLPFGHIADKATLPVGAHARLVCAGGRARLTMRGHPVLPKNAAKMSKSAN